MRAAFLDTRSVYPDDLDLSNLEASAEEWRWFDNIQRDELLDSVGGFDIIVSNKVVIDAEVIKRARNLQLICVAATGFNNVDLQAAQEMDIPVCNVQHYATASVVQHVFAVLLTLIMRLDESRSAATDGRWSDSDFFCVLGIPITELAGKTIGIIGFGDLGQAVASVAKSFGMKVLIAKRDEHDQREGRVALDELLASVDVVSLHCPLNEKTTGLIGVEELRRMRPDSILINTARGGLVDESALLDALKSNEIAGAALDVLQQEPPHDDSAILDFEHPGLLITPHVAWASQQSRQRLIEELALNIKSFRDGGLRNVVT